MRDRKSFDSLDDYFDYLSEQLTPEEETDQLCEDIHDKAHKSSEDDEHDES